MAPIVLDEVDDSLRAGIQNLYELIVQSHDHHGPATQNAQANSIRSLARNLAQLSNLAAEYSNAANPSSKSPIPAIPPEIIQYVEEGRNPDIYTREFVEIVQKHNQLLKGRAEAMARFRDILARQVKGAMPELEGSVRTIVEKTGGKLD
ncbi:MAG: RNA polymerase II mediator complex subunit [Bathelium mastoideum]|nr:MAG: RNA polymerase II mediator complex subunit [Bathelium mastoideum]KAI9692112.1 MAG: RNA polymerase II mediator complex subunit [Bathelium mastoideum]